MIPFSCFVRAGLSALAGLAAGLAVNLSLPQAARSAETIRILVDGPLLVELSVDSLATFAETGEITKDFAPYARLLDEEALHLLRSGLSFKLPLDVVTVDHLAYSPLGREALYNVGKIFQNYRGVNGQQALRAAVINAAAQADESGWTMVDVLQAFPTPDMEIQLEDLLALRKELSIYSTYNDAVVAAIKAEAQQEAVGETSFDLSQLADLSQPGRYSFTKRTITVTNPALRQTQTGLTVGYNFDSDIYLPTGLTVPAPVVIISHGFGDVKESFTFLAEHLASHGYVAIVPEHVGSDLKYREQFLEGRLNTLLSPMEFVNRPQEISFLIDRLTELSQQSPEWARMLDLEKIGMAGDSLGSSTALAIAGANIKYTRLVQSCDRDNLILNFALYLECRAQYLPPQNYDLHDDRVKAVITGHPLGASLYGPEGIRNIDVPLLMVSGSKDIVSPGVTEQFHPFIWLETNPKYLALLDVGTHFSSKPGRDAAGFFKLIAGEHRDVGSAYYKALAIAFWNVYLREQDEYLPYLTARYGEYISQSKPMTVDIITSLTPEQIEAAYGRSAPVDIIPPAISADVPPREESILAEIAVTGVLKVALRKDAVPFGFIDNQNAWDGYCGDLVIGLSQYLTQTLQPPFSIEVAELTSTLENRFALVEDGSIHLECGPNTIRNDLETVTFSNPFFVSSTQFLLPIGQENRVNPNTPLRGIRLGVLSDTTTEQFVEEWYATAEIVRFSGPAGRQDGITAAATGDIDAFVGDGILSYATVLLERGSLEGLTLIPELPLTCDYYGLILPNNDLEWQTVVNTFLSSEIAIRINEQWFEEAYPATLNKATLCLNR
jgi:predicted dienelactone hydrolase